MEERLFCSFCGKPLENDYMYCPYCGSTCRDEPNFEAMLFTTMNTLEKTRMSHGLTRLERLSSTLTELEEDLDQFLLYRPEEC